MEKLSILFIILLLCSFIISTKIYGATSCPSGYILGCTSYDYVDLKCFCFKKCPNGKRVRCDTVGNYNTTCLC